MFYKEINIAFFEISTNFNDTNTNGLKIRASWKLDKVTSGEFCNNAVVLLIHDNSCASCANKVTWLI